MKKTNLKTKIIVAVLLVLVSFATLPMSACGENNLIPGDLYTDPDGSQYTYIETESGLEKVYFDGSVTSEGFELPKEYVDRLIQESIDARNNAASGEPLLTTSGSPLQGANTEIDPVKLEQELYGYYHYVKDDWYLGYDYNYDRFLLKYDVNRATDADCPFKITWYDKPTESGVVGIFHQSPHGQTPRDWEILEDQSYIEPGLLLLKLPDNVTLRDALYYYFDKHIDNGIIYLSLDFLPINKNDERYAQTILNAYPQDRLYVIYYKYNDYYNQERPPWDILYSNDYDDWTNIIFKIPDGMTLIEAIQYCQEHGIYGSFPDVMLTSPAKEEIYYLCNPEILKVFYKPESVNRLPWVVIYDSTLGNVPTINYQIPENITLAEAISYCNNIDDIMYVFPGEDVRVTSHYATSSVTGGFELDQKPSWIQAPSESSITPAQTSTSSPISIPCLVLGFGCLVAVMMRKH